MTERRFEVRAGDAREVLAGLAGDSFDACLCDPPYGLGFMGKDWDHGVPGTSVWSEVRRVLKPGAILLAFGGTRTHHRLICAIEDAGFEIRDCLMWLYGSGFPKSMDISKAIDKANRTVKVVGTIPDRWTGKGNALNFSTDRPQAECRVTEPGSSDAVRWSGYGTALKPAWEPIIVAMKPCEGTFAENALKWGVAGLAIDASRIETHDKLGGGRISTRSDGWDRPWKHDEEAIEECRKRGADAVAKAESLGRWPANLILDEEAAAMLDEQSGKLTSGKMKAGTKRRNLSGYAGPMSEYTKHETSGDSGGASRFFYCAKASRSERGTGNTHPTVKPINLTKYLARLILPSRRDGLRTLLVPFSGSGSEILGAFRAGWDAVMRIDLNVQYCELARQRVFGEFPELVGEVLRAAGE